MLSASQAVTTWPVPAEIQRRWKMSAERWDLFGLLMKPREDGFWVQHSAYAELERVAKQLRDALENLQQPTTFSEAEQSLKLPMAMGQFIEQVDAANAI